MADSEGARSALICRSGPNIAVYRWQNWPWLYALWELKCANGSDSSSQNYWTQEAAGNNLKCRLYDPVSQILTLWIWGSISIFKQVSSFISGDFQSWLKQRFSLLVVVNLYCYLFMRVFLERDMRERRFGPECRLHISMDWGLGLMGKGGNGTLVVLPFLYIWFWADMNHSCLLCHDGPYPQTET